MTEPFEKDPATKWRVVTDLELNGRYARRFDQVVDAEDGSAARSRGTETAVYAQSALEGYLSANKLQGTIMLRVRSCEQLPVVIFTDGLWVGEAPSSC